MILDLETQIHQGYKRKANPFIEDNYIVARGWKKHREKRNYSEYYDSKEQVTPLVIPDTCKVIVAHNAKFELLYELRFSWDALQAFFKRGGTIWCTQYAEYLLQGQSREFHMVSLDTLAPMYGGAVKVDGVKELWEAGVQTSDICRDLLDEYLIGTEEDGFRGGDIGNTEKIFRGQITHAQNQGMLQAMKIRMKGLIATSYMEFFGLAVDRDRAMKDLAEREVELDAAISELAKYTASIPEYVNFNWGSRVHTSCIVFGGTIKYKRQMPYIDPKTGEQARTVATARWPLFDGEPVDPRLCTKLAGEDGLYLSGKKTQDVFKGGRQKGAGRFKSVRVPGEIKVKYQDFTYDLPGYTEPDPSWKVAVLDGKGNPTYSTAGEIIEQIGNRNIPFLKALGERERLTKEIGTYYLRETPKGTVGMLTCVMPDGFIHHKLNHTSTVTTRLSSNDPNVQNVTRADYNSETGLYKSTVKAMFVSRFGADGQMAELDYSQLEVVVQGVLSGDKNLIRDLNNRVDFHCKRASLKTGVSYDAILVMAKDEDHPDHAKWDVERTLCKIFSFQRAYGAGATKISDTTGMPKEDVEALIKAEELEYPDVTAFNEKVENEVNETAYPITDASRGWRTFRRGTFQVFTGTTYTFTSYDAPAWMKSRGINDTFKPTEMKNYPVQGTGGELVQMAMAAIWEYLLQNDFFGGKALLVNTVHDCFWLDIHKDYVHIVVPEVKRIMESIPAMLKEYFEYDCPVGFPADAEIGDNMLELHKYIEQKD